MRFAFCALNALAAAHVFAGGFALYLDRTPTLAESDRIYTGAKFEPRVGCYLGAFIDLDRSLDQTYLDMVGKTRRLPEGFEAVTGRPHATYFYYMSYGSRFAADWVQKLGGEGKIVHIALEPNNGLEWIKDDEYLDLLAVRLANSGAKIFLRFGSEMNGPWVKYHGSPSLYKEKFRLVAAKMKAKAPNVAMVWCPYATPERPITSYYPGDDAVDWVGVNLYSVTYYDQNPNKPAYNVNPVDLLDNVYSRYSAKKPIMVGEFGATHYSALERKSVPDFAIRSIQALYTALPRAYPRVKCINYFCGNNLELDHRKNNNYALTQNSQVLDVYKKTISNPYFLSQCVEPTGFMALDTTFSPVNDDPVPAVTTKPMAIKQRQKLTGKVKLSGWYRDISGSVKLRFLCNGKTFFAGDCRSGWETVLDTTKLKNGPNKLELRAERGGETLDRYPITVTVEN